MEASFSIDDAQFQTIFSNLQRPTRPLMAEIASYLVDEGIKSFKSETSPDGSKWAALNPRYAERKAALYSGSGKSKKRPAKNKLLQFTGTLADSISFAATDDTAIVRTNRPVSGGYDLGAIHQLGTSRMPSRPFFPIDDSGELLPSAIEEIQGLVSDYFSL